MRKNEREKFPIYVLFIAAAHTHVCISRAFESVFRQILIKCFTPLVHNNMILLYAMQVEEEEKNVIKML